MIIYDELKKDHDQVKEMLARIEEMSSGASASKVRLFAEMKAALTAHSRAEEKVFYDVMKADKDARSGAFEGYEEHHVVDVLKRELSRLTPGEDKWTAKFMVLKENVEHHIEEEEGELFTKAKQIFYTMQAQEIDKDLRSRERKALGEVCLTSLSG